MTSTKCLIRERQTKKHGKVYTEKLLSVYEKFDKLK